MNDTSHQPGLHELQKNWCWFVALGVLLTVLGLVALGYSVVATIATVIVFGVALIVAGVGQLINAFQARRWSGFIVLVLCGILSLVVGVFFLERPIEAAVELTLLIAVFLLVGGLFRAVIAVVQRHGNWGMDLLSGCISILLGVCLWRSWPWSGLQFLGICMGIDFLFQGASWLFFGIALKNAPKPAV